MDIPGVIYQFTMTDEIKVPSVFDTLRDAGRALGDIRALLPAHRILKHAPVGDGHTVLVMPGFLAGDATTKIMRWYLNQWGYDAHPWDLGINLGLRRHYDIEGLIRHRIKTLYLTYGGKVSLVGWSLGGLFAREIAREYPDMTRQVITLGSPIGGDLKATSLWRVYEVISGRKVSDEDIIERLERSARPVPGVPATAIYSESDGVVAWQMTRQTEGDLSQNIKVKASHIGMACSPAVLYAVACCLAREEDNWQPLSSEQQHRIDML